MLESIAVPSERKLYVSRTESTASSGTAFGSASSPARRKLARRSSRSRDVSTRLGGTCRARGSGVRRRARPRTQPRRRFDGRRWRRRDPISRDAHWRGTGEALLAEGRAALLASDFDKALSTCSRALASPAPHAAEAREYLGVARERMGQPLFARAEYERYLADYPNGEGAARVRQRLSGLVTAAETPRGRRRALRARVRSSAEAGTYRRGSLSMIAAPSTSLDEDQPDIVTLSACVFTDLDLSVRHSGESLDLRGRITINQQHDLIGEDAGGPGDRNSVSYAYFDLDSAARDWSLRVSGRQTLRNAGALGRVRRRSRRVRMGRWAPRSLHDGPPRRITRDSIDSDREFYGAAVDFDELIGAWDFSTFVTFGTIEGIEDRRATRARSPLRRRITQPHDARRLRRRYPRSTPRSPSARGGSRIVRR